MKLVTTAVPDTDVTVGVPEGWRTASSPDVGLLAFEAVDGRFAASVTAVRDTQEGGVNPVASALAPLVAPVLVDVQHSDGVLDLIVCHLAGTISATARQRHVAGPNGRVVVTVTAATSRWTELAATAQQVLDSVGSTR